MPDLKIVIPMAGIGKRLFPLTRHRPKALVRLAHKRLLDHVLNTFHSLEERYTVKYIFIVGYLGEQIREHMKDIHPEADVTYFVQEPLMGQSHAVYLARDAISGPILLTYCDTLNKIDFSFIPPDSADGVVSVQEVEDPSRFGVAVVGPEQLVTKLIEKPKTTEHRLALAGLYYFSEGKDLIKAIEIQIQRASTLNSEFYLADAINIMIQAGIRIKTANVLQWLDAGTTEDLIATNACLLQDHPDVWNNTVQGHSNVFIPPVYIDESSRVENSVIGPNVAIGKNCRINGSRIANSIIDDASIIQEVSLTNSLIGKACTLHGKPMQLVVADSDQINFSCTVDDIQKSQQI